MIFVWVSPNDRFWNNDWNRLAMSDEGALWFEDRSLFLIGGSPRPECPQLVDWAGGGSTGNQTGVAFHADDIKMARLFKLRWGSE